MQAPSLVAAPPRAEVGEGAGHRLQQPCLAAQPGLRERRLQMEFDRVHRDPLLLRVRLCLHAFGERGDQPRGGVGQREDGGDALRRCGDARVGIVDDDEQRRRAAISAGDRGTGRQRRRQNGIGPRLLAARHANDAAGATGAHVGANPHQRAFRTALRGMQCAAAIEPEAVIARRDFARGAIDMDFAALAAEHDDAGGEPVDHLDERIDLGVGGTLKLSAGGTAIDADFDEGLEQIFSGGTDIRGSIFEASQTIFAGGESDDAVLAIAAQTVSSGGFALRTVLKTIGEELVLAGGTSLQTSVLDRSLETLAGRAVGTLVESGGRINVSGGVASATILSSGGTATIGKGGTAIGSLVAGGSQILGSGGIASATRVGNAGFDHGEETVSAGGRAIGTVVTVGDQTVLAGGIASGTTAGNAPLIIGKQIVSRGGLAVGTIVKFQQEVASGGTTSATTITADGVTIVSSGGVIKGLTDLSGILVLEFGRKNQHRG